MPYSVSHPFRILMYELDEKDYINTSRLAEKFHENVFLYDAISPCLFLRALQRMLDQK